MLGLCKLNMNNIGEVTSLTFNNLLLCELKHTMLVLKNFIESV